ncbi:MAG TPA: methyltransferase [Acidimicrobiales bacterium]|nr:methyltransferase [Acidimicrobiales bacterium]
MSASGPPHYFSPRPDAPSRPSRVRLDLPDLSLELQVDRGVFSAGRIDPGTKVLLLEAPAPPSTGDVLDLGCGYGPIALALAMRAPQATVWAVDVNERALDLTRANASAAGLGNVRVATPDGVPDDVRFAAIWSNPPVRVGKAVLHDLLSTWLLRLTPAGRALLVVQKHLGSDSLHRWLQQQGWHVDRLTSRMAYRVLEVRRSGDDPAPPGDLGPDAPASLGEPAADPSASSEAAVDPSASGESGGPTP